MVQDFVLQNAVYVFVYAVVRIDGEERFKNQSYYFNERTVALTITIAVTCGFVPEPI